MLPLMQMGHYLIQRTIQEMVLLRRSSLVSGSLRFEFLKAVLKNI
jgi:hypothetical protein